MIIIKKSSLCGKAGNIQSIFFRIFGKSVIAIVNENSLCPFNPYLLLTAET